MDEITKNLIAL